MAIPDYQKFMLPLLKYAADNQEHSINDAINALIAQFNISEEEKRQLLPSGTQRIVNNRIGWARTYLAKAGLLESPRRGVLKITQLGLGFLQQNPDELNIKTLMQFDNFVKFLTDSKNSSKLNKDEKQEEIKEINRYTPQEALE
ncbi:MAG: winged helix-turn-helix domain-containing protein, partial [Candidatus Bilamarchaeaceae archaeon]